MSRFDPESLLGVSTGAHNDLNQTTSVAGSGGPVRFIGSLSEIGTVTVGGAATVFETRNSNFVGYAEMGGGTNIIPVVATDYSDNKATNRYQLIVTNNGVARTLGYDANGNVTNVATATGTNSFEWDASDRLATIEIREIGQTAKRTEFTYDGFNRRVRIVEKTNGVVQADNRFVWCSSVCEKRDGTGGVVSRRYLAQGEQIGGAGYFYTRDHLGSVRETVDSSGAVQTRYEYDPYGRRTTVSGTTEPDFAYTGHFYHAGSALHLAMYRALDSAAGRWMSRDPIGELGGPNLYNYVRNSPLRFVDPLGLAEFPPEFVGPLQPGDYRLPPFQPIRDGTRNALSKYFGDQNPEHLKDIPDDELRKARDNAGRACEKYKEQGRKPDKFFELQKLREKLLDDLLRNRQGPQVAWWYFPGVFVGEILIPFFVGLGDFYFPPNGGSGID